MRKIVTMIVLIGITVLSSCEGPQGPAGQNGQDGLLSEVFETTRSFTNSNNFSNVVSYPHSIYSSDMVLVYRLDNIVGGVDVWKLLPQTYYFNDGTLDFTYDFYFTKFDVNIVMNGSDLGTISDQFRINQTFRIVIIPGYFSGRSARKVDKNDYNAVIKAYNINDTNVKILN